jgi:hypothetical protein
MSDAIDTRDVTDRATAGGWVLPDGWTVKVDISPDDLTLDYWDDEVYSEYQTRAWENGDWQFVIVSVWVEDAAGREWGRDVLGGVEAGDFPSEDGDTSTWIDPLADKPAEYSVIREHDMIRGALVDTVRQLEEFGTPVIAEPEGVTMTGL